MSRRKSNSSLRNTNKNDELLLRIDELLEKDHSLDENTARNRIQTEFEKDVDAEMKKNHKLTREKARGNVYRKYAVQRWRKFFNEYFRTHKNHPDPEHPNKRIKTMARAMELAGKEFKSLSKQKRIALRERRQHDKVTLRQRNEKIEKENLQIDFENHERQRNGEPLLAKQHRVAVMPDKYSEKGKELQTKEEAIMIFQDCYLKRYGLSLDDLQSEEATQKGSYIYNQIEKMIKAMRLNMTKNRLGRGAVGLGKQSKKFYCTKRNNRFMLNRDFRGVTTDQNECSDLYVTPFWDYTPRSVVESGKERCEMAKNHYYLLQNEGVVTDNYRSSSSSPPLQQQQEEIQPTPPPQEIPANGYDTDRNDMGDFYDGNDFDNNFLYNDFDFDDDIYIPKNNSKRSRSSKRNTKQSSKQKRSKNSFTFPNSNTSYKRTDNQVSPIFEKFQKEHQFDQLSPLN